MICVADARVTHDELTAAGFVVAPAAYARLEAFVRALQAANERTNLVATSDRSELWRRHVCDSLALLPLMVERRPNLLLDLGTGGGLPGVPLACAAPGLEVVLVDSVGRKLARVRELVAALGLVQVRVVPGRAEILAHAPEWREVFDAVTARAVAPLPVLLEYVAGFVRVGGVCWLFKSAGGASEETTAAAAAAARCGLVLRPAYEYRLPGEQPARVVVIYEKVARLAVDLPRAPGRARKKPL